MTSLRRRLASWALAVCCLQLAGLAAMPMVTCAEATPAAHATTADCCPAGSHPPGQCPLHRQTETRSHDCRMTCAHHDATPFLLAPLAILRASATMTGALDARAFVSAPAPNATSISTRPTSPPPRPLL